MKGGRTSKDARSLCNSNYVVQSWNWSRRYSSAYERSRSVDNCNHGLPLVHSFLKRLMIGKSSITSQSAYVVSQWLLRSEVYHSDLIHKVSSALLKFSVAGSLSSLSPISLTPMLEILAERLDICFSVWVF
jgi:hypothetical protein